MKNKLLMCERYKEGRRDCKEVIWDNFDEEKMVGIKLCNCI